MITNCSLCFCWCCNNNMFRCFWACA